MPHFMPNSEPSSSPVPRWKSGLVHTLSLLLIWQPMLLSAQPITPTHGTNGRPTLDQAANGVPVVNIQNPNGKDVSQNFYNDLNVSDKGLVLNNSQTLTQTQLGGYIEGNPNLKNGSASLILNEVIGQNPSNLAGYIEVGGARADVVVANPNGISCNGCGFINTNHATLTTGQSIMEDGELRGFDVQGGAVSILGEGLNASNTERFDIIARSVTLAGELHADRLNIVTGQQQVHRETLATSNATSDGDKPQFAIDSSALGGMYANRIRLIANEDGVGMKLDAPVAAQNGDLQLSANGNLRFSDVSAQGDIQLASAGDVISAGNVAAGGALAMTADSVTFKGEQAGAQTVTINADRTRIDQGASVLGAESVKLTGDSVRNEGELSGKRVEVALDQGLVNDGQMLAGEAIHLTASTLNNRGTVQAVEDVSVEAITGVVNEGDMVAGNAMSVRSEGDVENTGTVLAGQTLTVASQALDNQGQLHSGNQAELNADTLSNTGSIVAAEALQATARVIDNQTVPSSESGNEASGLIQSGGDLSLEADKTLTNHARIVSGGDATLEAAEQLDNHGEITSQRNMTLSASQNLHNTGDVLALGSLIADSATVMENHGTLQALEHLSVSGDAVTNDGAIRANGIVTLSAVAGALLNRSEVTAGQHVIIEANRVTNESGGKIKAEGQLAVTADHALRNHGVLRAESALSLAGDTLTNHGEISSDGGLSIGQQDDPASALLNRGLIASEGPALLSVEKVENSQGATLQSQGDLTLINADSLVNQGKVIGHGVLSLEAKTLLNERLADAPSGSHDGTLGGGGVLFVHGNELVNRGGALLGSTGDMTLLIRDRVENNRSDIVAHRHIFIGAQLPQTPQEGEELTEQEALDALKTGEVINRSGQIITNTGEVTLFTRHLDNSRQVELAKEYGITGADLKEAVLVALREDPDNALLKLIADNGQVNEEDWAFIMDPGVYTLRLYTAASSNRYDWINHWVDVYSAYLNRQVSGTLSHNDIEAIRSRLLNEAGAINVQGARNPLAENFYLFARVSQLIKQRSPEKYDRLLGHMESKLENKDGTLNVWQVACGGGRGDWIGSSSKSCDNGYVRYYQFGKERYDDVIDPDSEAVASVISSAADMRIHADALDNRFSTLSSGGNMHLSGDTLTNEALELKRHYEARWGVKTWHNFKHEPDPGWRPWRYTHKKVVHAPLLDENGNRQVVSSVIAAGGDQGVVLDFTDEVGNYTKERVDQTVEFDTREYEETPAEDGGDGTLPGDEPTYTDWGGSDVARAIDTINARTLALLDRHGSLFTVNPDASHPYLIETNPLFNTLDGFLGSKYLTDRLGLDPNGVSRRLGDSYYETQLIRDAILAATGTRFLDPDFNSDKDQFQWLMDNALVAAESMELAVGVSLSPEQVNALQEDMVWMEEQIVAGHKVLVPVLYLAPGSQHLTNEGAVIAGNQVHITTDGLGNSGMIASNQGMVVNAGDKGVVNLEGTLQSGGQLLVDSLGDIKNQSGTVRGNGVVLQSQGDIIHEAWSERVEEQWHNGNHWRIDHRDAGVIDSTGDVVMNAGEHIQITGSRISGETVGMQAGGNIQIGSLATGSGFKGQANGGAYQYRQVRQLGSEIEATLNVLATAGNSIGITASTLNAGGDIGLTALHGDILIQAAANEDYDHYHAKSSDEERTRTNHTVRQQQSALNAGGSLSLDAGNNLIAIAAKLESGGDMHLKAGNDIALLAAQNSDYHFAETDKDGDYGAKSHRKDEVQKITNLTTELNAGGNLVIDSEGNQHYQAAQIRSDGDITIESGGHITFEAVKDLVRETHEKSQGDLAWQKMEGEGFTDETLLQTAIVAQGNLAIEAAEGLTIDVKQIDQASVSGMIDGMVANNPDLAWLKEAEARGDVNWQQVKEIHDSWDYESQSMGAASALVVAIVVTVMTAGAAAGAGSIVAGATSTGAAGAAATAAVVTGAATTGASALINNQGDLGATLDSLDHSETYQSLAVSGITAGFMTGVDYVFGGTTDSVNNITKGFDLNTPEGMAGFTLHNAAQAGVSAGVSSSIYGTSFSDAFEANLESQGNNVLSALAFNQVGNLTTNLYGGAKTEAMAALWKEGGLGHAGLHAVVGGAVTDATGGEFATGAAAAGLNQLLSTPLDSAAGAGQSSLFGGGYDAWRVAGAQLAGIAGAVAVDGDVNDGAWIAKQADTYNRQLHKEENAVITALREGETAEDKRRLNAAACYLVRCAEGIPEGDSHKADLVALQEEGAAYQAEQDQLEETGLFTYGKRDSVNDFLLKHEEAIQRVEGGMEVVGGMGGVVGGGALAIGGCGASAGILCGASVGGGAALISLGYGQSVDGANTLFGDYASSQGENVLASFGMNSYPGEQDPALDLAWSAGGNLLLMGAGAGLTRGMMYLDDVASSFGVFGRGVGSSPEQVRFFEVPDNSTGNAADLARNWQTQFPYVGQDPMRPIALSEGKILAQVVFDADVGPAGSYFTTPSAIKRATLSDGSIDANILNQGLQIDGSKYPSFRANVQYFRVNETIPYGEAAFGRTIANQHLNPGGNNALPQVFLKEEFFQNMTSVDMFGNPGVKAYPMVNTETPSYLFQWLPKK